MSNAVTKIDFDAEQRAVIKAQFFPTGATESEMQYCFAVSKELGMNPLLREIQFVPRRQQVGDRWVNKIEPMVGRDGFLSIAHRTNQIAGMETSASIKEVPQLDQGQWRIKPQLVAECTVWRKDSSKPFTAQVSYNEYCQKTADGTPTRFWSEKPETMLKKVAESQALRKAFNIHGVYCPEEIGGGFETESGEIITAAIEAEYSHTNVAQPPEPPAAQVSKDTPPPVATDPYEDRWPEPPGLSERMANLPTEGTVGEIIALLDSRHIPFDIDMQSGVIAAKSYNERQLLKESGFKWNADIKSWIYSFEPEPF